MFNIIKKENLDRDKFEPQILYENDEYFYLPRYITSYKTNKFIIPYTDSKFIPSEIVPYEFTSKLRDEQSEIIQTLIDQYEKSGLLKGIIHARPGTGKCQGKDTPIIMYDGSIKMIQDIKNGDLLMGPDSTPRLVNGVTIGYGDMYKVTPIKGASFTCNGEHVLSLKSSYCDNKQIPFDSIINISINDYITKGFKFKEKMKLWRSSVKFNTTDIKFDPYIIGIYLSEGTKKSCSVTIANDSLEILDYINEWCINNNYSIGFTDINDNCSTYGLVYPSIHKKNPLRTYVNNFCITENNERHIPKEYLINDRYNRLQLLAGILDGDGNLNNKVYEIVCKDNHFAEQICFLSRSLGFACYKKDKIATIKSLGFEGLYYRCIISGNVNEIPCKVKRKQSEKRIINKNVLKVGFSVEYIGKDNYYGFSLDGDHLYMMGDFTVTHNTVMSIWLASKLNKKTLIVINTIKIIEQWREEILRHSSLTIDDIGLIKGDVFDVENKRIILTTPQTLSSKIKNDMRSIYPKIRELGIDLVCQDECHQMGTIHASASLLFNTKNVIGLSATPYNPEERDILIKSIFDEVAVTYGEYDFQPTVKFVKYNSGLGKQYGKRVNYLWMNNFIQGRSIYNSKLHESENQINTIYEITKKEVDDNKRIIIICMTKQQLNHIYDHFKNKNIRATKLYSEENTIDKEKDDVIIATYKYASHAFDYKELSRLILAVPLMGQKSLIQTIGRIVRRSDGKTDAIVYDLIDIDQEFNGIFIETIKNKINILNKEFDDCKFIT